MIPSLDPFDVEAGVAQSVERKTLNLVVEGSSPSFGATFLFCEIFLDRIEALDRTLVPR